MTDAASRSRKGQYFTVEVSSGYGSPPSFGLFRPVYGAKVDLLEIGAGSDFSRARIWFPDRRWHDRRQWPRISKADRLRISIDDTVIFCGYITHYLSSFSGGSASGAYERNSVIALDHRWLLDITSPVFGVLARTPDDYSNFGTDSQSAQSGSATWLSGRRAVFNLDGRPNKDPSEYDYIYDTPIFADYDSGEYWSARQMIRYLLSPRLNLARDYWDIDDPADLDGLDHADWNRILYNVAVDGLTTTEAIELIASQLGWGFREAYDSTGDATLVFYELASAEARSRSSSNPTVLHTLHAPDAGENISSAVAEGKKMLWSAEFEEDITRIINNPWALGAPDRFEFTAELVPAWSDDDLVPDTSDSNANLYFTDAELQELTSPNSKDYYKYYYPRGSDFKRNVGRKWALNESGRYTGSSSYDRGAPFDFTSVLPAEYILDSSGNKLYGPFARRLLPTLTADPDTYNPLGIIVEFSFDGGTTWQAINAAISSLEDEAGIYINEANLAELVDQANSTISGGDLDGEQLNLFTSLCDDKLNSRSYKDGEWNTRVRVTASIQMDTRLARQAQPSFDTGSPFWHREIFDYSQKGIGLAKRTESSSLSESSYPAVERDSQNWMDARLSEIRRANEDQSISGRFTLDRIWPDTFAVGDSIERITGRDYDLSASMSGTTVYPEIIKILLYPDRQRMSLITRDLRFAEVRL